MPRPQTAGYKGTNCYLDLAKLKAELGITDTAQDPQLLRLLNRASRFIDNYCQRHFYMKTEAKVWRTKAGYWHDLPDLVSLTLSELDDVAIVEDTDFETEPRFGYPKIALRMLNTKFTSRQKLELTGIWGYCESATPYYDSAGDVADDPKIAEGAVTLTLSDDTYFSIGQTLKIEDEQVYVTGLSKTTHTATIIRGVNGTTDADHVLGKSIYIYAYPDPVVQACLIQTLRWYRGRDAAWGDEVGIEGKLKYGLEPHPSVRVLLNPYRRITGGF